MSIRHGYGLLGGGFGMFGAHCGGKAVVYLRMMMSFLWGSRVQSKCGLCVIFVQQLLEIGLFNGRVVEEGQSPLSQSKRA